MKLDVFLASENITSEQMHESIARMQRVDPNVLMCMDYLLAGVEYQEFLNMMLDFKEAMGWCDDDQ